MGRLLRALGIAGLALILTTAVALAAGPKKGATYTGAIAHGKALISLKVAKNGKSVTVNAPYAPAYCSSGGGPTRQITKAAKISGGRFSAVIAYEFTITHKVTAKLYVSGKFAGKAVSGRARSEFGVGSSPQVKKGIASCQGSSPFAATTK